MRRTKSIHRHPSVTRRLTFTVCALTTLLAASIGIGPAATAAPVDDTVYLATAGALVSVNGAGGPQSTILGGTGGITGIVVAGDTLYFTDNGGLIESVPVAGGVPTVLASGLGLLWDGAIRGDRYYFIDFDAQTIKSVPLQGGTAIDEIALFDFAYNFALAGDTAYVPQGDVIIAAPLGGGEPETIVSDVNASGVAVVGTTLYFVDFVAGEGVLKSVPITGGVPITIANGFSPSGSLAATEETVYLAEEANNPRLFSVPTSGGPKTLVADGFTVPYDIDVSTTVPGPTPGACFGSVCLPTNFMP